MCPISRSIIEVTMIRYLLALTAGKIVSIAARIKGGGSALPGLVAERIDPRFALRALRSLPQGVVIITGTNGKTTTAKIATELLESQGVKVFTNGSGSNFMRGVISSLLPKVSLIGKLDKDIAVLELDEAHAVQFVKLIKPRISLLLNIHPDQLDRFPDTKAVAKLLHQVAKATTETVIFNYEDGLLRTVAKYTPKNIKQHWFGLSSKMRPKLGLPASQSKPPAGSVILADYQNPTAILHVDDKPYKTNLLLTGPHNALNAAAAISLTQLVLGSKSDPASLMQALGKIEPAEGRGEKLTIKGQPLELVLVKNTRGFQLSLDSYDHTGWATMLAINNRVADGHDTSWLEKVDFKSLSGPGVSYVSGDAANYAAAILAKADVRVAHTNIDSAIAVERFIGFTKHQPKRIFCNYTALQEIRSTLDSLK